MGNCLWKTKEPTDFIGESRREEFQQQSRADYRIYSVVGCVLLLRGGFFETGSSPAPLPRSTGSVRRNVNRRPFFSRMIVDCPVRDVSAVQSPEWTSPLVPRAKRLDV